MVEMLKEVGHIGYIVDNLDASIAQFQSLCRIDDFIVYDFVPTRAWVEGTEIFDCHFKIGLSQTSHCPKIELIEVVSGEKTPHSFFLAQTGQNIHHIAYYIDDYDYWHQYYENLPEGRILFEAVIEDEIMGKRKSFYAICRNKAVIIEIVKKLQA